MPLTRWIVGRTHLNSRPATLSAGLFSLALVGFLDWMTGPNVDFSLFYLVPVCVVTWGAGQSSGFMASILCAAVWLVVDRLTGARPALPLLAVWNSMMRLAFFAAVVLLLTSWKHAGKKLSAMVEQRTAALRRLAAQLSAAEYDERRKLAYDMHDTLGQTLSLIKMNLDAAQLDCPERASVQHRLGECGAMLDDVIKQARTLMFDLYPAMLDDLGLVPTIRWFAKEFPQRVGAELIISEQGSSRPLPTTLANYLFRAVQELCSNAARHGRAKAIILTLHWDPAGLRLVIDDDGTGFDVASAVAPGQHRLGLAGIDERISSMGGRMELESRPGQGSRVILEVPLPLESQVDQTHAPSLAS
jgi:signal transduction histidine kinase